MQMKIEFCEQLPITYRTDVVISERVTCESLVMRSEEELNRQSGETAKILKRWEKVLSLYPIDFPNPLSNRSSVTLPAFVG